MYTIVFSKKFLSGNLKGMTVSNQRLTLPTMLAAKTWVWDMGAANNQINRDIITKDKYIIPEFRIEEEGK